MAKKTPKLRDKTQELSDIVSEIFYGCEEMRVIGTKLTQALPGMVGEVIKLGNTPGVKFAGVVAVRVTSKKGKVYKVVCPIYPEELDDLVYIPVNTSDRTYNPIDLLMMVKHYSKLSKRVSLKLTDELEAMVEFVFGKDQAGNYMFRSLIENGVPADFYKDQTYIGLLKECRRKARESRERLKELFREKSLRKGVIQTTANENYSEEEMRSIINFRYNQHPIDVNLFADLTRSDRFRKIKASLLRILSSEEGSTLKDEMVLALESYLVHRDREAYHEFKRCDPLKTEEIYDKILMHYVVNQVTAILSVSNPREKSAEVDISKGGYDKSSDPLAALAVQAQKLIKPPSLSEPRFRYMK